MVNAIGQMKGDEKDLLKKLSGYRDGDAIALLAELLPSGVEIRAADLNNHASNSFHSGVGELVDLAKAVRDPAEQAALITQTVDGYYTALTEHSGGSRLNKNDFEILSRRLGELRLTPEGKEQVRQAIEKARTAAPKPSNQDDDK
jgi:hypothetical protein